ncbi:hypothetical protein Q8A67_021915 [Cirrhinus molitorella]|uniref:Uncharacterized protein n=1 Tax=Cirrhinus molitorella TaxID=172907 RepID=A0AA88PCG3_9TELE|nr:hypothetical protein Q8A67_021915 [Cirrhinus molitorella]
MCSKDSEETLSDECPLEELLESAQMPVERGSAQRSDAEVDSVAYPVKTPFDTALLTLYNNISLQARDDPFYF